MTIRTKPDGGFRLIGAYELLGVYYAYSAGLIRWCDVRVWFAAQEAVARRCGAANGVLPQYREFEIAALVGAGALKPVRAALKRLDAAGLMHWTESAVTFSKPPKEPCPTNPSDYWTMVKNLGQANRRVPIPRRTIRFIAEGTRKVLAATMLGHVLRCCYLRDGAYRFEGSCSAAWVARLFNLDERNVKAARKQLAAVGWLAPVHADAWHRQRFGGRWVINPQWASREGQRRPKDHEATARRSTLRERSPRIAALGGKRSPLLILKENSFGSKNQKPALVADPPTGFCKKESVSSKPPTWKHVVVEDLRDTARTLRLFEDGVDEGFVRRCEGDRLKVFAAAERALRVADRNPCGFFVKLVRGKLWHHVNHEEEERARRKLQRHFLGGTPPPAAPTISRAPRLSMDAMVVAAVKRTLIRHGVDVDAFEALRRERPDWTQERWLRAESELAGRPIAPSRHFSGIAA